LSVFVLYVSKGNRLVFPSFHEALFAVDWPVSAGLEWDFRLLPALRTNGLVHLSWAEVSSLTAKSSARPIAEAPFLKWHFLYLLSDFGVVRCFFVKSVLTCLRMVLCISGGWYLYTFPEYS
jgi:hypothetical protein